MSFKNANDLVELSAARFPGWRALSLGSYLAGAGSTPRPELSTDGTDIQHPVKPVRALLKLGCRRKPLCISAMLIPVGVDTFSFTTQLAANPAVTTTYDAVAGGSGTNEQAIRDFAQAIIDDISQPADLVIEVLEDTNGSAVGIVVDLPDGVSYKMSSSATVTGRIEVDSFVATVRGYTPMTNTVDGVAISEIYGDQWSKVPGLEAIAVDDDNWIDSVNVAGLTRLHVQATSISYQAGHDAAWTAWLHVFAGPGGLE